EWVTLISKDNYQFVIDKRFALRSIFIRNMELPFENGFAEAQTSIVKFPNIRGIILEKVVEYLCWNARYFDAKDVDIPDFQHRIKPEIAVELLMAADYLE
ncbi:POZ domain-containing protein, partial [Meira miltonrushii]